MRNPLRGKTGKCEDCQTAVWKGSRRCDACNGLSRRGSKSHTYKTGKYTAGGGYVMLSGMWDHPNANKRGEIKEHIYVMSQKLNRKLVKGENVHHKNGVRDDNHIDNLELWYKPQPGGQRVTDLIDYLESTGYEVRKR